MKYHDAASIKYATRYIFKWTGNDRGLMLLRAIVVNMAASMRHAINPWRNFLRILD